MKQMPMYPFAVSESLVLELSEFDDPATGAPITLREFGGKTSADDSAETPSRAKDYDLTSHLTWQKLTFRLVASLAPEELARVLPATSDPAADTVLVVRVVCPQTRYRHGVRLRRSATGDWVGHTTIQRFDVKGSVILEPQLVRSTGIPEDDDLPYASKVGSIIAIGEPATLYLDTQPKLGLRDAVSMHWEDFANSSEPWRREHPEDVYHLEPFGAEPTLWLNSRYSQLRDVLESPAKRGPEALLREMVATLIAQPVVMQLALTALTAVSTDDDSGTASAPLGWRGDWVAAILPALYPEEAGEDERLRRVSEELREGDGAASLLSRLGTAVQELVSSYKTVESAVRTFEVARDGSEDRDD